MTVGGAFVYVCENLVRGRVNDFDKFEQQSRVYNAICYNADYFPVDPNDCVY